MKLWYVITFHLYLLKMTFSARHARNILHPLWIRYCLKVGMSSVMVIYCQCRARIISFCYAAELPQNSGIYQIWPLECKDYERRTGKSITERYILEVLGVWVTDRKNQDKNVIYEGNEEENATCWGCNDAIRASRKYTDWAGTNISNKDMVQFQTFNIK